MFKLSEFGEQLSADTSIVSLMSDLGEALNTNPDLLFLGGGNPAQIEAFEQEIAQQLLDIAANPSELHKLIGIYQSPQGSEKLINLLVDYFNRTCGWSITSKNIAITNGSQSAFFILINMLAGQAKQGRKHFLFPLVPEYLGYSDQALGAEYFVGCIPHIELTGEHEFKYHIDFENLTITEKTAALCVSRPTNPSGNIVSDSEIKRLSDIAKANQIPLIIDSAYGAPFPNIMYETVEHIWDDHIINVFSLSKLGLPAARTGIVVAHESVIRDIVNINTVMSLANGNFGPELMSQLLTQKKLDYICHQVIQPYYLAKRNFMIEQLTSKLQGVTYRIHKAQGAFFLWIWFPNLSINTHQLYEKLKTRGVLVMDGEPFFFAIKTQWAHKQQCLRLSYCQPESILMEAVTIISNTVRQFEKN